MTYTLVLNDILSWAAEYTGPKFMAIMCDPPYHLTSINKRFSKSDAAPAKEGVYQRSSAGFMGQKWDGGDIAFHPDTWAALSQHLYPGGFIMAFAGTRGYHRMACAMEDSGLIIHPALGWVFLSGFCKATRIDTQVDKAAGNIRPDKLSGGHIGMGKAAGDPDNENELENRVPHIVGKGSFTNGTPVDPLAQTWAGHRYGLQALKPAFEFIAVAQVPYQGRPVDNITETGAGAWNIDGSRIATDDGYEKQWDKPVTTNISARSQNYGQGAGYNHEVDLSEHKPEGGRWPANLLLDEAGAALLDHQSGEVRAAYSNEESAVKNAGKDVNPGIFGGNKSGLSYNDSGGASRMFFQSNWHYEILEQLENADSLKYEPKVSTSEREAGLDELPVQTRNRVNSGGYENDPKFAPTKMKNHHPTLKPISLTKYLATLLLPPAAYAPRRILIPFAGSGSEGIGCILAGWEEVVMIEASPDYVPIAEARLKWWSQWPGWGQTDVDKILASLGNEPAPEQLGLFDD